MVTIKIIKSAKQKKNLSVINEVLWQIESEFAPDSQQALYDFNKLILGSGKHKLFIGPQVSNNQAFIDSLLPAAQACLNNDVYIALAPHPADWETEKKNIDTWIYDRDQNRWKALL